MESRVKAVMSTVKDAQVLHLDAKLSDALHLMRHNKQSCVIVCDAGKPAGIVTERDMVHEFSKAIESQSLEDIPIADIMTPDPICIEESMSIFDALLLARSRRVRHLPVIDEKGNLLGMLAHNDTIEAYFQSIEVNEKLKEDYDELQVVSLEDPMLKIGNRRALKIDLEQVEAAAKRYEKPYAIAMFDVDYFKKYNDKYGHPAGDEALKMIASTLKKNIRQTDKVYRYGGEEFLLLMPNIEIKGAEKFADRVRVCIEAEAIPHELSPHKTITVSAGVTSTKGNWKDAIDKADAALYQAKDNGRNQVKASK